MAGVMMSQLSFVTSHHRAADERKLYLGLFGNLGLWGLFQQLLRPEQQKQQSKAEEDHCQRNFDNLILKHLGRDL